MDDYNGPKTLIDANGQVHPLPEYVEWLEAQITTLEQQLAASRSYNLSLRKQLEACRKTRRTSRWDSDYVPYQDDDDRR